MKSGDHEKREQLKRIRSELQTKRSQRTELNRRQDEAVGAFGFDGDYAKLQEQASSPAFKEFEQVVRDYRTTLQDIENLERAETAILGTMGSEEVQTAPSLELAKRNGAVKKWDGYAMLRNSAEYRRALESNAFGSEARFGTINLGRLQAQDPWESGIPTGPSGDGPNDAFMTTTPGYGDDRIMDFLMPQDQRGLQPFFLRPTTLYDLIPKGVTSSNVIQYVQLTGMPQGFDYVEEGEVKPQLTGVSFEEATAPVRTIAGYYKITRIALQDMPLIASMINSLLPYELRRKLEQEIVTGDGTGQHFEGLLEQDDIQTIQAETDDTLPDAILRGITAITMTQQVPSFAVVSPKQWQDMAINKASDGHYLFNFSAAMSGMPAPSLWGLPIIFTQTLENPLVGDNSAWGLYFREGVTVRTSDSDQDDFIRNIVTILVETRCALVIWRPTAFCVVEMP